MIRDEMKLKILKPVFIIKNFVKGDENCNYEKILLELVNASLFFREKSNFEVYKSPETEDMGECDCISCLYKIDFKLAAANSRLRAQNLLSMQCEMISPGIRVTTTPKLPGIQIKATNFHAVLRGYTMEQLEEISLKNYSFGDYEYDISCYINNLKIKKNLFFLFPYEFFFQKKYNFKYAIDNITVAIQDNFGESMRLRQKHCSNYDTYISFVYDNNLIVLQLSTEYTFKIVDVIYLFKSKTYKYLYDFYLKKEIINN